MVIEFLFVVYFVLVGVWVGVGLCDEGVMVVGVVYFFEYLLFKLMFICFVVDIV